jgi:hypothetical protein
MKLKNLNQIILTVITTLLVSCATTEEITSSQSSNQTCGTYNGHQLYKGSSGGCYYINSNNNKTYVDASHCNCN